jgi:hypothetical protein
LWKSLAPLAFVTRLRKDTRRTLRSNTRVRRADERGLRYKAYVTTTPRRCFKNELTSHGRERRAIFFQPVSL